MALKLPPLKEVERLSPRVIRIMGGNPGKFTLQGTNTYLVGQGASRILIDTGEGIPSWKAALKRTLDEEGASIHTTVLTHWHKDHVGGVSDLLSLGSAGQNRIYKHLPGYKGDEKWSTIEPGQTFKTEGATLRALFCPGHTQDHMAFVFEEENALFAGDNILGHGSSVFEDLTEYTKSLKTMGADFKGRAYPGHGEVIEDGPAKLDEYIKHREERERQILDVLAKENEKAAEAAPHSRIWSPMQIVKVVYHDVPESLHLPAENGVVQVLHKLKNDGRVTDASGDGQWRLTETAGL